MVTPTLMYLGQQKKEGETFHIRIISDCVGKDGRCYSMPTTSEVAALRQILPM